MLIQPGNQMFYTLIGLAFVVFVAYVTFVIFRGIYRKVFGHKLQDVTYVFPQDVNELKAKIQHGVKTHNYTIVRETLTMMFNEYWPWFIHTYPASCQIYPTWINEHPYSNMFEWILQIENKCGQVVPNTISEIRATMEPYFHEIHQHMHQEAQPAHDVEQVQQPTNVVPALAFGIGLTSYLATQYQKEAIQRDNNRTALQARHAQLLVELQMTGNENRPGMRAVHFIETDIRATRQELANLK